ncbi:MAG TPA: biosynthetic peptidoglycan transglycosylase, partial [Bacteroidia bacterium]|nr:biosynthetic peptidoglycan transglycosylase [Bacteroidia bacterium]
LKVYNTRISADTVLLGKTSGTIKSGITRNYITVDSSSVFKINDITFSAFAQYPVGNEKLYELKVNMPETPAQTFFSSLPAGMFNTFAGIQVKGNLSYSLNCRLDGSMPDSVEFTSELKKEKFEIIKYGKENFARINGPFLHTVYENGNPLRSFVVGPENPAFTPLENISVHFKNAVLINEDPSFFYHHGFIPQSFREAIAEVYKAGFKFVRGGSTISMQLVKNAYLERKKTIARKAEEALIVWLIESNRLSSKERMFEVYLNIIEMAPGVYGIGEGSQFYFNKRPADLSLAEGIYLSNIIPRPKAFKYGFEKNGTLKPWLQEKTNLVIRRMVQREWLPAGDTLGFSPLVQVKGPAKNYIVPGDSILVSPVDTVGDDDFFIQ